MNPQDFGTAPLDPARLRAVTGGNARVECEFLIDFRESTRTDAADLRRAVQARNAKALLRATHRIKGASWIVGALPLAAVCECIESAGKAADWPQIDAFVLSFEDNIERLNLILDPL
jgi:HPt (histidine-containing phosphotransfer) domain-containing protein